MSADDLERAVGAVDLTEAPALGTALEEIRRQYDDEEARREAVEAKTGGLLALDTVLIPLVIELASALSLRMNLLLLVLLFLSGGLCLVTLRSERYRRPLKQPENVLPYAQADSQESRAAFLRSYVVSLHHNRRVNNRRYRQFNWALLVTTLAVGVTALVAVLPG